MKEWFESWFDTEYYHILYKNHDFTEAENFIKKLVEKLPINSDDSILDLACGRGRHSIYLASLGFQTTGIDLSPKSIAEAQKYESDKLSFFVHDMRRPIEDQQFDVVVNLFTSFGYFSPAENEAVLKSVRTYLKDEGKLVIDYLNAITLINLPEKDFHISADGIDFHIHKKVVDNQIIKTISFEVDGELKEFEERVRLFTKQDFEELMETAGFQIVSTFGNYDLEPFVNTSERLIVVAVKK